MPTWFHEWLDRWLARLAARQHERVLVRRRRRALAPRTPVRFREGERCPCGDACKIHPGTWYVVGYDAESRWYDLTREPSGLMPVPLEVGRFTAGLEHQLYAEA